MNKPLLLAICILSSFTIFAQKNRVRVCGMAASTTENLGIVHNSDSMFETFKVSRNNDLDLFFEAVIEATEEAIINSIFVAETLTGFENTKFGAIPIDKTIEILNKYNTVGNV
jgi:D-aminopeptidase